jgi:hypothetical protein
VFFAELEDGELFGGEDLVGEFPDVGADRDRRRHLELVLWVGCDGVVVGVGEFAVACPCPATIQALKGW